jgi:uncharacterized protein
MNFQEPISGLIERIARAIERLVPREADTPDFEGHDAFVWQAETEGFLPIEDVNRLPLPLLKGIDRMRDTLLANTMRFARGLPANNALHLRGEPGYRFILFCDDLSFEAADTSYKSLKAVLEGGIEGRLPNVLFYATSNRRHLMPRDMVDNERSTAINPGEAVEEKLSLSDRFGLWIGFHNCSQDEYLDRCGPMPGITASTSRAAS